MYESLCRTFYYVFYLHDCKKHYISHKRHIVISPCNVTIFSHIPMGILIRIICYTYQIPVKMYEYTRIAMNSLKVIAFTKCFQK